MAAPGKRQGEGDRLVGRHPGEEPQLQAHRVDGGCIPQCELDGQWGDGSLPKTPATCRGCGMGAGIPAHPFQWESIFAVGGDCKVLPGHQQPSQWAPGTVLPSGTSRKEPGLRKAKNWHKDGEIKTKKKKGKKESFGTFLFHLQLLSLQATLVLPLQVFSL